MRVDATKSAYTLLVHEARLDDEAEYQCQVISTSSLFISLFMYLYLFLYLCIYSKFDIYLKLSQYFVKDVEIIK